MWSRGLNRADPSRDEAANEELGAVREDAKPVDVSNVIATIDRMISPGTAFHTNIAKDSIEGALANVRNKLTDSKSNLTDFQVVQRISGDVSDLAQSAAQSRQGRLLRGVLGQLDQLENASEEFLQANRNYTEASRDIEAVQAGRQAATRGRSEDTIPAHQALRPEAQAAFRSGYVDPLIAQTEGAASRSTKPGRSRTMRMERRLACRRAARVGAARARAVDRTR